MEKNLWPCAESDARGQSILSRPWACTGAPRALHASLSDPRIIPPSTELVFLPQARLSPGVMMCTSENDDTSWTASVSETKDPSHTAILAKMMTQNSSKHNPSGPDHNIPTADPETETSENQLCALVHVLSSGALGFELPKRHLLKFSSPSSGNTRSPIWFGMVLKK